MRLLLSMFKHETNTFSPVPTPFERFFRGQKEPLCGDAAIAAYRSTGSALGGYIDTAYELGAEIVVPVAAEAWPSGPVDDQAYQRISDMILEHVAKGGYDGILLDLHGAMVTASLEDGEGVLLKRIHELDARTPVGVTLDMHANICHDMIRYATVVNGYHTYPHVDAYEAGRRTAGIIARTLTSDTRPTMVWDNKPMLPHVMCQSTYSEPNKSLQAKCIALEREKALAVSLFVGFPHADIAHAGLSAVVCTDNDPALAHQLCEELLSDAWQMRHQFIFRDEPLEKACARAKQISQGPIVLLDHCDNAGSGGTMDSTVVLAEILHQGLENAVFYAIYDPESAEQAVRAGIGAQVNLSLGGKIPMPALRQKNRPLEVSGRVKLISDGIFRNRGPMYRGLLNNTGTTVVLDTGQVEIVIISQHQEPFDVNCLYSVGIDPLQKRYIVLKSRVHWRAGFGELAREVIECRGMGVTTSDYTQLQFKNVRRPIYPLDPI